MEPQLVVQLDENAAVHTVFVVGDTITLCQMRCLEQGILVLFAVYFLLNINYPVQFSQFLGLLQVFCLGLDSSKDFPKAMQSSAFIKLYTSMAMYRSHNPSRASRDLHALITRCYGYVTMSHMYLTDLLLDYPNEIGDHGDEY